MLKNVVNKRIENLILIVDQVDRDIKIRITEQFDKSQTDINSDQYIILETIYYNDGLYKRELSNLIFKERSMVSRSLKKLESLDYIEILIGTNKNRLVKNLFITQKGKSFIETNQQNLKTLFSPFLSSTSDKKITLLTELLIELKNSLNVNN